MTSNLLSSVEKFLEQEKKLVLKSIPIDKFNNAKTKLNNRNGDKDKIKLEVLTEIKSLTKIIYK